jgi:hypothetical protein
MPTFATPGPIAATVQVAGAQVRVTVPGDKTGSVAITIDLPSGSGLVAYLAHSDVHADGSFGECELHMASGRVALDRIDALEANISAGEVSIGHIAGRANIDGVRGQIWSANAPQADPQEASVASTS